MDIENIFTKSENPLLAFLIAAAIALFIGYLVQWGGRFLILRVTRRFSIAQALLRSTAAPMQLVIPLIFLQFVLLAAPNDWSFMPRVRHATGLLFIVAVTWLVIRSIRGLSDMIVSISPLTASDNLHARRVQTQTRVIARALMGLAGIIGVALMLMTFPAIRSLGASLLASAGLAGIVAGLAARPVLGNLIAGLQLALGQPMRLDDVVIIEGEWGRIEEITGSYVVVALWDQRRLIVPLQWFIEHPFQNWTRNTSEILGSVMLWVDYGMPMQPLRDELDRICKTSSEWDGRVAVLQITDMTDVAMQVRILVSSPDSSRSWDLRCKVREGLIAFMQSGYADYFPRRRAAVDIDSDNSKRSNNNDDDFIEGIENKAKQN